MGSACSSFLRQRMMSSLSHFLTPSSPMQSLRFLSGSTKSMSPSQSRSTSVFLSPASLLSSRIWLSCSSLLRSDSSELSVVPVSLLETMLGLSLKFCMALGHDLASSVSVCVMAVWSGSGTSIQLTRGLSETSGCIPFRFSEIRNAAWLNA